MLVAALPLFIGAGWPILAWGAVTVGWSAQRAIQAVLEARAARSAADAQRFFRWMAAAILARVTALVAAIAVAGAIDRDAGLAAALLALTVFTTYLAISVATRRSPANSG